MGLIDGPVMGTLRLSMGAGFRKRWRDINDLPHGSEARIVIWDNTGVVIGELRGFQISPRQIEFDETEDQVAHVPHDAKYALYLDIPGLEPYMVEHGTVVRHEPVFPLAPPADLSDTALQFADNFDRDHVGPRWIPLGGNNSLDIHTNVLISDKPSLGPRYPVFTKTAARWRYPMNMDSVTLNVRVLNVGAGNFFLMVCGDYVFTNWLGIRFETGIANNNIHVVTGNTATSSTVRKTENNTVSNGNTYSVKYSHAANVISVYKNTSLTPIIEWEDVDGLVKHGDGFRYTGLGWATALLSPGVEPTRWEARDGV